MTDSSLLQESLTRSVIGAFYAVYNGLGFGFLEQLYSMALEQELIMQGHRVTREFPVVVKYKSHEIGQHRLDMVIDGCLVIEIKSTRVLSELAPRQLLNYLRCTELEVGLLLHFGPQPRFYRSIYENALKSSTGHPRRSVQSV